MAITASLTAQNTYSEWFVVNRTNKYGIDSPSILTFSIYGTWAGSITIQRRFFDNGTYTSALDVISYTANAENNIDDNSKNVEYRLGFKTGDYTSGTANVRIGI